MFHLSHSIAVTHQQNRPQFLIIAIVFFYSTPQGNQGPLERSSMLHFKREPTEGRVAN